MSLTDDIAKLAAYADSPPQNEAATCHWVVYPLLQALGYAPMEIHPQGGDNNGQYPDYAILPANPNTWYVEAKTWNVKLQDSHVHQALNYANHNGKRWVVLTNGAVWRLYDNHVHGVADDKFVAAAHLCDLGSCLPLFEALRKDAYLGGSLDGYARTARLQRTLCAQFANEESAAVKALWSVLKKESGLGSLSRKDLVKSLSSLASTQTTAAPAPLVPPTPPQPPYVPQSPDAEGSPLTEMIEHAGTLVTGKKPKLVRLPDGTQLATPNWRAVAVEVVSWFVAAGKLPPLPFRGGHSGKRYFLSATPLHMDGKPMVAHGEIGPDGALFLGTHRSGIDLLSHVADFCEAVDHHPSDIMIEVV